MRPESPGRRGTSRLWSLLVLVVLVAGGLWSVGCEQCEERFCSGVRVATVHMMASANACCDTPDAPECVGLDDRFEQFILGLHAAYQACLDGNLERLRELLELVIKSLSRAFLIMFCAEDVDLGDWMHDACHPYVNSSTPFIDSDRITADIGLRLDPAFTTAGGAPPHAFNHSGVDRIVLPGVERYRFTSGSSVELDAWWGAGRFLVDGHLVVSTPTRDASGAMTRQVLELGLDLVDDTGRILGRVAFNGRPAPGLVRCTPEGDGMLGASVRLDVVFAASGLPDLAGYADTIWLELPIRLDGRGGALGSGASVPAQQVFPVDPVYAARLAEFPPTEWPFDGTLQDDDTGFMPCDLVDGLTVREWRWLQRMRQCFPQCFAGD